MVFFDYVAELLYHVVLPGLESAWVFFIRAKKAILLVL